MSKSEKEDLDGFNISPSLNSPQVPNCIRREKSDPTRRQTVSVIDGEFGVHGDPPDYSFFNVSQLPAELVLCIIEFLFLKEFLFTTRLFNRIWSVLVADRAREQIIHWNLDVWHVPRGPIEVEHNGNELKVNASKEIYMWPRRPFKADNVTEQNICSGFEPDVDSTLELEHQGNLRGYSFANAKSVQLHLTSSCKVYSNIVKVGNAQALALLPI